MAWWRSEIGRKYRERNEKALERDVTIGRIFITDDVDDPDLDEVVRQHCDANGHIFVITRALVPAQ